MAARFLYFDVADKPSSVSIFEHRNAMTLENAVMTNPSKAGADKTKTTGGLIRGCR